MNTYIVWALVATGWCVTVPLGCSRLRTAGVFRLVPAAWLPAAAGWLLAALLSRRPGGFDDHIVLLTSAHFVHAGFGVSTLLVIVRRPVGLAIHQVGMIAVAAGINGWIVLQPVGAIAIVIALTILASALLEQSRASSGWRRPVLIYAALAWTYPMLLAVAWAFAQAGHATISRTLDAMVAQHGLVNVTVVLAALVAWSRSPSDPSHQESSHDLTSTAVR